MTTVNGQQSTDFEYSNYRFIKSVSYFFTKSYLFVEQIEFYFVTL